MAGHEPCRAARGIGLHYHPPDLSRWPVASSLTSLDDVARLLDGVAHRTPIMRSRLLDELAGAEVFLKVEAFQVTGSFKFRGMYTRLASMSAAERLRGVVIASSGNAGQALARAAQLFGVKCTVFGPRDLLRDATDPKLLATTAYGADLRSYDRLAGDREELRNDFAARTGSIVVPSSGDPAVIAGQGTAVIELLDDVVELDAVVVPVAGGGLLAGAALAVAARSANAQVIGVEPIESGDMKLSLAHGRIVPIAIPNLGSIADSLLLDQPSGLAFEICREHLQAEDIVLVDNEQIRLAMRALFSLFKIVAEPGGAAGLAAVLARASRPLGKRIGIIVSGGNISPQRFSSLIT